MTIDVHAHYVPQTLLQKIEQGSSALGVKLVRGQTGAVPALEFEYGFKVRPFFPKLVEPVEERCGWMDAQRIDRQLVATWPDIYGYALPPEKCAVWHRALNDTLADWCAQNARRFSFVASLPLPNAEDAAAEMDRAHALGAVAIMLPSNVEGVNIGELALDALWSRAEALRVPIIIHPVLTTSAPRASKYGLTQSVQYTFDTTLGAGSLIFSGVLDRFPELTFVLSHGGGALPYLVGRFDVMHARMDRKAQSDVAAQEPSAYARQMGYDSIVHAPEALRFLADRVGLGRILLGSDYSFPPADLEPLTSLRNAGFSDSEVRRIAEENPRAMFPGLANL